MGLYTFNHGEQIMLLGGRPLIRVSRKRDLGRI